MTADRFVRPAVAGDEPTITDIQLAAWTDADLLGTDVLALLDPDAMRASWQAAITAPPGPGYRVLVACDGPRVVGFASVVPRPADPEAGSPAAGTILALEVAPDDRRSGHASRLLAAVVDLLRTDGATEVSTWVLHGDEARARFLAGVGLGPDGAQRHLTDRTAPDDVPVLIESRWSATI
ncbi:MAG: GNAT family N-acetyltransferase [Micrococcales bacterium]|nr:GNAT family N-acetyltransferase [Micrococcales bacterium]